MTCSASSAAGTAGWSPCPVPAPGSRRFRYCGANCQTPASPAPSRSSTASTASPMRRPLPRRDLPGVASRSRLREEAATLPEDRGAGPASGAAGCAGADRGAGPSSSRAASPREARRSASSAPKSSPKPSSSSSSSGSLPEGGWAGGCAVKTFSHTEQRTLRPPGGTRASSRLNEDLQLGHSTIMGDSQCFVPARGSRDLRTRFRRCRQAGDNARRSPCHSRR